MAIDSAVFRPATKTLSIYNILVHLIVIAFTSRYSFVTQI